MCAQAECSPIDEIRRLIELLEMEGGAYEAALAPLSDFIDEQDDSELPLDVVDLYHNEVVPRLQAIGTHYLMHIHLTDVSIIHRSHCIILRCLRHNVRIQKGKLVRKLLGMDNRPQHAPAWLTYKTSELLAMLEYHPMNGMRGVLSQRGQERANDFVV